jgi:hypothetical protein
VTRAEELIAAVAAEPPGRGFLAPGASPEAIAELEEQLLVPLPADLKELLLLSDGIGVARTTGFYLASVQELRRLAHDDRYDHDFPGALPVGDDGATGTYLVDLGGVFGTVGDVLLTNRGSLLPRDTVRAGSSVSDVLAAVLSGDDLWDRPRLGT